MGSQLSLFSTLCRHLGHRVTAFKPQVLWPVGMKYSLPHRNPWNLEAEAKVCLPSSEQTDLSNSHKIEVVPQGDWLLGSSAVQAQVMILMVFLGSR